MASYLSNILNELNRKCAEEFRARDPNKIYWTHCMVCGAEVEDKYDDWDTICDKCGEVDRDIIEDSCNAVEREEKIAEFARECIKTLVPGKKVGFNIPEEFHNFGHEVEYVFYNLLGNRIQECYVSRYNLRNKKVYVLI